jgi:hypothetical protein
VGMMGMSEDILPRLSPYLQEKQARCTHRAKGSGIRSCIGTFQAIGRPNFPAIEKEPMPQAADMFPTPAPSPECF